MKGIYHKDVGTELTYSEYHASDAHSLEKGTSFPSSPSEGDLYYRTDQHKWYIFNGTSWEKLNLVSHSELSGLDQDDHPQYLLADGSRSVSGHLKPSASNSYDLGSSSYMWRSVYLRSRLYISGTGDLEWSLHSNGEHLEVREPEDGDKIWLKMEDGVGIHLNPDGTQVLSILTGQITPYKSIVPSSDNALDLGSSSYRWRNGYFAGFVSIADGLLKTNSLSLVKPIYIRGTGLNHSNSRVLIIGGTVIYNTTGGRGLRFTVINKSDYSIVHDATYDTYGSATASDQLAADMDTYMTYDRIGILTSYDAWENQVTSNLKAAFKRFGLYKAYATPTGARRPYAAIFEGSSSSAVGTAKAIEVLYSNDANAPYAEIRGWLIDGSFVTTRDVPNALSNNLGTILSLYVNESGDVLPGTDNLYDFGSSSLKWKDGFFAGNLSVGGYGNLGSLQIGGTEVITSGRVLQNVSADAGIITSGIFDVARIPDLDASKITSGVFDLARIPSIDWTRMPFDTWSELLSKIGNSVGDYLDLSYLQIGGSTVITSGRVLQNIASIAQSLLPDGDNTRNLGSSNYFWRDLYLGGSLRGLGNVQILIQSRQTYGTAIRIQGGSSTIIAGGEGGDQVWNNIANLDDEWLYLASDQSVKIITALQGGWSARIENATFSADGNNYLRNTLPSSDNSYDLGSTSRRWKNGYFVNIHTGDLILKNGFKISETEDSVVIYSPFGQKIFEIDLDGNVLVFGEIKYVEKN